MAEKYDFSGYATKNDLKCADGRTIRKNAFKDCDGEIVPLVWQHKHGDPGDVLGHALLENREDGVYTYGSFNNTDAAKNAKELVRHGDVRALSIYANQLVQKGGDVLHGIIREVSLCLAGANPGARIEDLSFEHCEDEDSEFEARIYNGENIELYHSANEAESAESDVEEDKEMDEETMVHDAIKSMNEDQYNALLYVVDQALAHAANEENEEDDNEDESIQDIIDTMNDKQKDAMTYVVAKAMEMASGEEDEDDEEDYEDDDEEDSEMMQHAYDSNEELNTNAIAHDALDTVIADGKRFGSLRESYKFHLEEGALAHAIDTTGMDLPTLTNQQYGTQYGYGVNSPEMLYPEAKSLNTPPEFIQRDTEWADVVWANVHRTPFSRIKSVFANITEDEARAKGYIKGAMKKEEFFSVMKRVTVPQTVYKKQKLDRDDIIDITDFDVVRWIRAEMRVMWNEETARAFLIGDGRDSGEEDKISEEHIRPIASDKPLFSIQKVVDIGATDEATAKNFMKAAVRARKDYKGSGNPMLFTTEDVLTSMLLIEDGIGHRIYKSEAELATAIRVSRIVTVPVMEGHKLANGNELMGIIVNLKDYNVGTDKGGEINLFDDFDIDYNQYKYLIESRCSGALIKPYSAIVLSKPVAAATPGDNG
jgi:HK97 family phage prohead protease